MQLHPHAGGRRHPGALVLTLVVWISYHVEGIRAKGFFGYLKHTCIIGEAPWWLRYTLLMVIEFVEHPCGDRRLRPSSGGRPARHPRVGDLGEGAHVLPHLRQEFPERAAVIDAAADRHQVRKMADRHSSPWSSKEGVTPIMSPPPDPGPINTGPVISGGTR